MTESVDFTGARWRKATPSEGGGCVEVAFKNGKIGVRDTKDDGRGPVLVFTETEWQAFLGGVHNHEFTIDALRS